MGFYDMHGRKVSKAIFFLISAYFYRRVEQHFPEIPQKRATLQPIPGGLKKKNSLGISVPFDSPRIISRIFG